MCFNAEISLATFISGLFVSLGIMTFALLRKEQSLAILAGGWSWVIFMQWWEFMIWKKWEPQLASRMAYVFNIMQIPILYLLFIIPSPARAHWKWLATIVIVVYLVTMMYPGDNALVRETDHHLAYSWWSNRWKTSMYFIGLAAVFLCLVRPFNWSLLCVSTLFVLLGLSIMIYGKDNIPSLWCFFAVFFPIVALFYYWLLPTK